jgi:hypothetical protein
MVQQALIASRSFQPGLMMTDRFISAVRTTRIRRITYFGQGSDEILKFQKINEDRRRNTIWQLHPQL